MKRILAVAIIFTLLLGPLAPYVLASGGGGGSTQSPVIGPLMTEYDKDQSGTIDAQEFASLPEWLQKLDEDGDGELGGSEIGSGSGGSRDPGDLFMCVAYALIALLFSSLCSVAEAVLLSISLRRTSRTWKKKAIQAQNESRV